LTVTMVERGATCLGLEINENQPQQQMQKTQNWMNFFFLLNKNHMITEVNSRGELVMKINVSFASSLFLGVIFWTIDLIFVNYSYILNMIMYAKK